MFNEEEDGSVVSQKMQLKMCGRFPIAFRKYIHIFNFSAGFIFIEYIFNGYLSAPFYSLCNTQYIKDRESDRAPAQPVWHISNENRWQTALRATEYHIRRDHSLVHYM